MSISNIFKRSGRTYLSSDAALTNIFHYAPNHSGVSVSEQSAMQLTAVSAAVNVISNSIASQNLCPYKTKGEITTLESKHATYKLLKLRPNPFMTSFGFLQLIISHALRWGNGYAWIELDEAGRVLGLWPLAPWSTTLVERDGRIYYMTNILGKQNPSQIILDSEQVIHIRAIGSDGFIGASPIKQHAEEIGIQIAAQNFGAEFFGNGAVIQGYLKLPGKMSEDSRKAIKASWKNAYSGTGERHQTPVLTDGMEYKNIGIPPEEAQFLQTRQYGDAKIAQIYNVPPHMIGDLSKATFSNITEETINFLRRTLTPWFTQIEQEFTYKLLSTTEQKTISFKFDRTNILKGTPKEEAEADVKLVNAGIISRNEARDKRNMNPKDGLDHMLVPLNMIETDDEGKPVTSESNQDDQRSMPNLKPLIDDFAERFVRAANKASESWNGEKFIERALGPIAVCMNDTGFYFEFLKQYREWDSKGRPEINKYEVVSILNQILEKGTNHES